MDKRKLETDLKLTLYVLAAKAELDNLLIGLGDVEQAVQYIWDAYELADSKLKKLLKQAYDLISSGNTWKARKLLEQIIEKNRTYPEPEEF
jgi:tetratricopeptide (TPR) repeat protein